MNKAKRHLNKSDDLEHINSDDLGHSFNAKSDKEIWDAFRNGHEGAFSCLYDRYFDVLYGYGIQVTRDNGLIEDLLQDFYLELRQKRRKLNEVTSLKAYLIKSFRRKVLRFLKKKQPFLVDIDNSPEVFNISFQSDFQFIKAQFDEQQQLRIAKILNGLTKREREAIYYFYFEDLSYHDISSIMGLNSPKSARNLIYKALSVLKQKKSRLSNLLQVALIFWL